MKSKSTEARMSCIKKEKAHQSYDFLNNIDKSFDFVGLYKTAAETSKILENAKSNEPDKKTNTENKIVTPKRDRSPHKNKKKRKQELIEVTPVNIDASSLDSRRGALPNKIPNSSVSEQVGNVKSIMKNSSLTDQTIDIPRSSKSSAKPKKRNKSVSFMLEDNEELVIKRTKSDDSIKTNLKTENRISNVKDKKKQSKKFKKLQQSEKENTRTNFNKHNMDVDSTPVSDQELKSAKVKRVIEPAATVKPTNGDSQEKRKKYKKIKKYKPETVFQTADSEVVNNTELTETKNKKLKKKSTKSATADTEEESGEPISKSRKTDTKADIVEDLENLSIGDNAHTLTNLLDEMTVADKDKKKKLKQKLKKKSSPKGSQQEKNEKSEEGVEKEKIKWNKRKWNKDRKGNLDDDTQANTVIVENLPLKIMLNYKKLLTEHFVKYGLIKNIGLAEVYPTEESKPVFTTTINFYSDGAATQALDSNNTEFEGSRIRVKQPLPRTQTTVVVRSYAELTDQNISSAFLGAGKIRSIRHLVKGKKSMATAFIEFDGPGAVKYALTKMADTKIGGKRIHVAKFEPRLKKKKVKTHRNDADSAADADSEDSND